MSTSQNLPPKKKAAIHEIHDLIQTCDLQPCEDTIRRLLEICEQLNEKVEKLAEKSAPEQPSGWWQCGCGWLVTHIAFLNIKFDAPCPRCGARFSSFRKSHVISFAKEGAR